jgi:hypothetical protein
MPSIRRTYEAPGVRRVTIRDSSTLQGDDRVRGISWSIRHTKQITDTSPNEASQVAPPEPRNPEIASLVKAQESENNVFLSAPRDVVRARDKSAVCPRALVRTRNNGLQVVHRHRNFSDVGGAQEESIRVEGSRSPLEPYPRYARAIHGFCG